MVMYWHGAGSANSLCEEAPPVLQWDLRHSQQNVIHAQGYTRHTRVFHIGNID